MNEDRIKGAATELGGKVKDAVGGLVGDAKTRVEGKADEAAGQVQAAYGAAKDEVRDAAASLGGLLKEKPLLALLSAVGVGYILASLIRRR